MSNLGSCSRTLATQALRVSENPKGSAVESCAETLGKLKAWANFQFGHGQTVAHSSQRSNDPAVLFRTVPRWRMGALEPMLGVLAFRLVVGVAMATVGGDQPTTGARTPAMDDAMASLTVANDHVDVWRLSHDSGG